jgi:hypothetical protein
LRRSLRVTGVTGVVGWRDRVVSSEDRGTRGIS